ncbi:bifunctional 3-(3-hydroxy-phenyl)propionate/3-hydroxycinnamic acid hydroxylase [Streptomyces spongiae]|uniref:Bifunctional 3-(3-hydroxy-phenyl)propionate/3-hydroxycinnamic acid hydroxylase n=1 Tax=Streptomyces spongiae TaxID=565072 RepID=A0A5N8XCE5_9ACTN|nr:bifunctional 3-(3-hydroxy-phenyl)propionate/3-hydroxycinnamic acid hydroxylase [Streptomyces spongiae]MPY57122.1 bifunctional 3-(3-hydroxy-phenyl)propionate/3-hydroxycinnamic acid hydroxylase [Streptomyces spongiae]
MADTFDTDVAIVGLGPVGTTAANLADSFGLTAVAFDRATDVEPRPRAVGFDQEAMRVFGNLGLADAIAPHTMPYRPSEYRNHNGQVIKRIDTAPPPHPLGWAPNYVFLQPELEKALRQRLTHSDRVDVHLGTTVTNVEVDDSGATVEAVDEAGRRRRVRTRYLLACDGGSSPIRARAGLPMRDLEFDEPWLVVDVLLHPGAGGALPRTNVQYCETARPSTFVVGPGSLRRWELMINKGEDPEEMAEPHVVRELLSRWLEPGDYDLWRASAYRFHALVLKQWRAGRLFFLGDAAHMTPPFLAQGMCQGIRDASNLMWKLAAHRYSGAGGPLLDTYQEEREPHVLRVTATAKEYGRIICERDDVAAASRDARLLAELAARPGGTIRQSLIPGLQAGFLTSHGSPARGEILPQPRVTDSDGKSGLLDAFAGNAFRLVLSEDADIAATESALREHEAEGGFPIQLLPLHQSVGPVPRGAYREEVPVLTPWLQGHSCEAALARPDHYVFGGVQHVGTSLSRLLADARRQYRTRSIRSGG